jgi:hypothetical protein
MRVRSFPVLAFQSSVVPLSLPCPPFLYVGSGLIGPLISFRLREIFSRTFSRIPTRWSPFVDFDRWDSDEDRHCHHVNILIDTSTSVHAGTAGTREMLIADGQHRCLALSFSLKVQEGCAKVRTLLTWAGARKQFAEHVTIVEGVAKSMAKVREWLTAQLVDAEVFSRRGRRKSMGKCNVIQIVDPYPREHYEISKMNGGGNAKLRNFISRMMVEIKREEPKHTVLVSDDPEFVFLCEAAAPHTDLAVCANSKTAPPELKEPSYNFRPLEVELPNLKIQRIDVQLHLENIFIGLVQRGWRPDLRKLIGAVRQAIGDVDQVVAFTAYADCEELNRQHSGPRVNWQRELLLAGGESRHVVKSARQEHRGHEDRRRHPGLGRTHPGRWRQHRHHLPCDDGPRLHLRHRHGLFPAQEGGRDRDQGRPQPRVGEYRQQGALLVRLPEAAAGEPAGRRGTTPMKREDVALMLRIADAMHRNYWLLLYLIRWRRSSVARRTGCRRRVAGAVA